MASSGSYKKNDIPDEAAFIPSVIKPEQTQQQVLAELMKLNTPIQG
jgi:hypothetical protein